MIFLFCDSKNKIFLSSDKKKTMMGMHFTALVYSGSLGGEKGMMIPILEWTHLV